MNDRGSVRDRISKNNLTHVWMINQLRITYGITVDKSTFSGILSNTVNGDKAETIVLKANLILDDYERYFVNRVVTG